MEGAIGKCTKTLLRLENPTLLTSLLKTRKSIYITKALKFKIVTTSLHHNRKKNK